ncbi:hypothetical protein PUR71_26395 [Streptomyces sp. SP17BM10]|uniref:hypothetical protein n=1 Tax=Streptomyces sp. SP17BM10 TaxID=3002530 RepID=UPI002E762291|nr:hypothetical protein [Streptomyces sp. SP17BM10]MEE1786406.1 hypothetical protein [Streptomyces sp. SP17BM10]
MPDEPQLWELRLALLATPEQAERIKAQVTHLLCPDPDHAPPCPVPWSAALYPAPDDESHPDLRTQAAHERRPR